MNKDSTDEFMICRVFDGCVFG